MFPNKILKLVILVACVVVTGCSAPTYSSRGHYSDTGRVFAGSVVESFGSSMMHVVFAETIKKVHYREDESVSGYRLICSCKNYGVPLSTVQGNMHSRGNFSIETSRR